MVFDCNFSGQSYKKFLFCASAKTNLQLFQTNLQMPQTQKQTF
jgi:hypothetical protein